MAVAQNGAAPLSERLGGTFVGTRDDLDVSRHVFFGETSYVIRDPITFDGHNLSPTDYEIFTNLSDDKPLSEVCDELIESGVFEANERESFFHYVVELQKRNLLSLPVTDSDSLFQQYERKMQARSKGLLMKLLFLKIPLGCPDRFLKSTYHLTSFFFTRAFFTAWLILLLIASGAIISRWSEFTSDLASLLAIQNLPIMLGVMAVLKLWHELGHGYACRHFGVSVPNAGILLMMGTPLAFMDATGSWSLPRRRDRQIINLAGIYFELMISIVAAAVWILSDNSSVKSVAHFALLISSVTTIAFNINPLMKYDGYFVLADLLGIPNLKSRSAFTVQQLFKYVFFGLPMPPSKSWLLQNVLIIYGIAAGLYRISLTFGIAVLIAMQVWLVGIAIGVYYLATSLGTMLRGLVSYLIWSEEITNQRRLAMGYLAILLIVVPAAVFSVPLPGSVQAQGVVESANLAVVHTEHGGFVSEIAFAPGQTVSVGKLITKMENIEKSNLRQVKKAELNSLLAKHRRYKGDDRLEVNKTEQQIKQVRFELSSLGQYSAINEVTAPIDGVVIEPESNLKLGQYIQPGGEVVRIGGDGWVVKAIANDSSLAEIRPKVGQRVHCRFLSNTNAESMGTIRSVSASGDKIVPFRALTHLAGGFIPVQGESLEATEPFFEMEIEIESTQVDPFLKNGMICEIRFDNSYDSLGTYLYRSVLRFYNQIRLSY